MAVTLEVAIALPFLLPSRFSLGPRWFVPLIEATFLVALVVADPGRIHRRSALVRALSGGLVAILAIAAGGVTARLVVDLIRGGPRRALPACCLASGRWSGPTCNKMPDAPVTNPSGQGPGPT